MANQNPAIAAAAKAAMEAVKTTAEKDTNNVSIKSVTDAQPEMTKAIEKAVAADPVVQNATNTEAHFWQKRTMWSMAISFALVALNPILQRYGLPAVSPEWQEFAVTVCTTLANLAAGGLALWAGKATRPLFVRERYPMNK